MFYTYIANNIVNNLAEDDLSSIMAYKRGHSRNLEKTTIYISKENKELAMRLGINLSAFFDYCLERLIRHLMGYQIAPGLGFEPRSPEGHGLSRPAQYHSATPALIPKSKKFFKTFAFKS